MKKFTRLSNRASQTLCLTLAGLAAGAAVGQRSLAQTQTSLNPCPGIYYEEPFNQRFLSPVGCPANAARQSEIGAMPNAANVVMPGDDIPLGGGNTVTQPPLPEERSMAIARVMPMENAISVSMFNETNAPINYQVLGETEPRTLMGGETVLLQGLPLPSTITTFREDEGLVDIKAMGEGPGMLKVMLSAQPMLSSNQGVLRIQEDGQVFLN